MSIEKTSAARLRVEGAPYTTLPNETLQTIRNPDALAIWAYLQSQATGWRIIRSHIMMHFSLGRARYSKAMDCLRALGLIETIVSVENDTKKILGREIVCYFSGKKPKCMKTHTSENPHGGKTHTEGKPTLRENDHLYINQDNINESKKREMPETLAPRKQKTPYPHDLAISDSIKAWAARKGHGQLEEHLEAFKEKCLAHNYKYADWEAAFKTAVRQDWAGLNGKGAHKRSEGLSRADMEALAKRLGITANTGESWEDFGRRVYQENERRNRA